jgi:hypothetical protein
MPYNMDYILSAADRMSLVEHVLELHTEHVNDDDGDKYLSDPNLAIQALETIVGALCGADLARITREGWIT